MSDRPYVSFAEVKETVPIPDVLEQFGILEQFTRKKDVLTGCCPLPDHQHGPSPNDQQFKINRKNDLWLWHCFGDCQRGGDVIELVKALTDYDDAHVRFWFAEHFGDRLSLKKPKTKSEPDADGPKDDRTRETTLSEDRQEAETTCVDAGQEHSQQVASDNKQSSVDSSPELKPLRFRLNLDPAVPYLRDRGLSAETIERYGLGLCNRGLFKDYIAIPIYGFPHPARANPLAYLGRWPGEDFDEDDGRPRYRWPEGFLKSLVVYGLAQALETDDDKPLIVVEGPFKVYHLVQAGFPNTVAIFGSSLSDAQAEILLQTGRSILLFFDGNEAGYRGMRMAAAKLITGTFVRVVRLPESQEPDSLSAGELTSLLA